jgi:hypothetical protein
MLVAFSSLTVWFFEVTGIDVRRCDHLRWGVAHRQTLTKGRNFCLTITVMVHVLSADV